MSISDEELAAVLKTRHYTDKINTEMITPGDHIDSELVGDGMLLHDSTDDDRMQIGLIETNDGHLIRAHRPGDDFEFAADDVEPSEYDPMWIVNRMGDFSSVLSETETDEDR